MLGPPATHSLACPPALAELALSLVRADEETECLLDSTVLGEQRIAEPVLVATAA